MNNTNLSLLGKVIQNEESFISKNAIVGMFFLNI